MSQRRVMVVSENRLFASCLAASLTLAIEECETVLAPDVDEAQAVFELGGADVILFDSPTDEESGVELVRRLTRACRAAPVLVLGRSSDELKAVAYLEAGAADYRLADGETMETIGAAVDAAVRGEIHYSPQRLRVLFEHFQSLTRGAAESQNSLSPLTDRELEVLRLLEEGLSNREIASHLHLSLHTVKNHVHHILEKVGAASRMEAVHFARRQGWLLSAAPMNPR
jgi:DNA-binding NarL/FixJ family response regulator